MPEELVIETDRSMTIEGDLLASLEALAGMMHVSPEAALTAALRDALAARRAEVEA
jgi:hypothetical protein